MGLLRTTTGVVTALLLGACSDQAPPVDQAKLVADGERLHGRLCVACHSTAGARSVGPPVDGLVGTTATLTNGTTVPRDAAYLRRAIVEPGAEIVAGYGNTMPAYAQLASRDVDALVAYLESLPPSKTSAAKPSAAKASADATSATAPGR